MDPKDQFDRQAKFYSNSSTFSSGSCCVAFIKTPLINIIISTINILRELAITIVFKMVN